MTRYHLNPDTGRVGICRAEKLCPLVQAIHGETKEEARRNFEYTMMAREFPILKKEKPFEPVPIESLKDVAMESGGKRELYGKVGYEEILWFRHRGEVIGYAKIFAQELWWTSERDEVPQDKFSKPGEPQLYYTLADFEVRAPGMGHGRKLLEKLKSHYGSIYTTGGATPEGAKFLRSNGELFSQDPAYKEESFGTRTNITKPDFDSSFESMTFVQDWDNSRSRFPL